MKKLVKQILILIVLIIFLVLPYFVFADTNDNSPLGKMTKVAGEGGFEVTNTDEYSVSQILGTIIQAFLSLLGIIFIFLMLIGGYHWMTAAGNQEKVDKAINTIKRAIIGLIIVVGSYAVWYFIFEHFIAG